MKKIFRKITALLVAFMFICSCGVNAFAQSYTGSYTSGGYVVNANYSINQKSTSGTAFLTNNGRLTQSSYLSASVDYCYHIMVGGRIMSWTDTETDTKTNAYEASVSVNDATIYSMVYATYTFVADIPSAGGAQRHQVEMDTIYYP